LNGFAGLSGDLILDHAFGLILVLSRVGATLALLPGLGETSIPAVVKAGMVLILSLLLIPIVEPLLPPRPTNELAFALMVAAELADGIWFGWLARILTSSLPVAAQFIADFAGLSNILLPAAELGPQTTAIARLYEVAVPVLILSTGLYTVLLSSFVGYYRLIPPGSMAWVSDSASVTVSAIGMSFHLAVQLAAPFILASIAWNVAIGLLARLVPRLQIFFVGLPGQIGLGLLLLAGTAAPLIAVWNEAMRTGFTAFPGGL
jgi:flagellar biosynthetic protein FliR